MVENHIIFLKTIYIQLISISNYPSITWNDFTLFVNSCKLIDENLSLSTVDRLFIATKSGGGADLKDFPERDLSRFEFLEIIVRMASAKYKESGKAETYTDAVRQLIENDLLCTYSVSKWQDWREKYLWTLENHDMYDVNIEPLKKIFKSFQTTQKTNMDLNDCLNIMTRTNNLIPTEKDVVTWFGLSKMTMPNEFTKRKDYNSLSFVEFLEFIARMSEYRSKFRKLKPKNEEEKCDQDTIALDGSLSIPVPNTRNSAFQANESSSQRASISFQADGGSLTQKIEEFLEELFKIYGQKRKEVKIEIEFETDEDEDD